MHQGRVFVRADTPGYAYLCSSQSATLQREKSFQEVGSYVPSSYMHSLPSLAIHRMYLKFCLAVCLCLLTQTKNTVSTRHPHNNESEGMYRITLLLHSSIINCASSNVVAVVTESTAATLLLHTSSKRWMMLKATQLL